MQVIERSCRVSKEVNSSSSPTNNFLFEKYSFTFNSTLTVNETGLGNGNLTSQIWQFNRSMDIILPLSCSIESNLVSCGAVKLKSSKGKKVSLKYHRMKVLKRVNTTESEAKLNRFNYI